jgi:rhombotail lipoprotein
VDYLYPDKYSTVEPSVPVLSLPLKVGIAFVPSSSRVALQSGTTDDNIAEADRLRLLRDVSAGFKALPFVKSIDIIPSAYMQPRGGFANLDQLQSMFGVDVIALVSYDQVQFSDQSRLSLTYWTLVGAYLVNGEKNETRTLMDAAVYDIKSRKLLFRAPGVSTVKGSATPVNLNEELRRDRQKGFEVAASDLKTNLTQQLDEFKTKIKESPAEYQVVRRPEYKGGGGGAGAVEPLMIVGLLALAALAARRRGRGE